MSRALLFRNALVADGSGAPRFQADVRVESGLIAAVEPSLPPGDARLIDCAGLTLAPGFIDAHSHSDIQVLNRRREKSRQGVTAEVVGNCGFSAYPSSGEHHQDLLDFAGGIFNSDLPWGWNTAREYLDEVERRAALRVVSLAGHGSLRIAVAGARHGDLGSAAVDRMESLLAECFEAGAAGFSTGLMYAPGESAPFEELERLCRVTARYGRVYATHIRSYFHALPEAVEEQLELARRTGVRLQISHVQAAGSRNWQRQRPALDAIDSARASGIDVAFDCYPYVAGSTVLTQILPQWALDGGTSALLARLASPSGFAKIAEETESTLQWNWSDIYISAVASAGNQRLVGCNLAQIAEERGVPSSHVTLMLLLAEQGKVNMLSFNQSETNLRETLTHPASLVISDGFYVKGRPHPRLHGTFPTLLGEYVRERKWMALEEAVRKITSAPAERFRLLSAGLIAKGCDADLVLFDPDRIGTQASYDKPEAEPDGIRFVMRAGKLLEGSLD